MLSLGDIDFGRCDCQRDYCIALHMASAFLAPLDPIIADFLRRFIIVIKWLRQYRKRLIIGFVLFGCLQKALHLSVDLC